MKIPSLWPWPQGHSRGGDGADKNFRPISTTRPNMNEIHQKVFKTGGLINFNAKTLYVGGYNQRLGLLVLDKTIFNFFPIWILKNSKPQGRVIFDLRAIIWTSLVEAH